MSNAPRPSAVVAPAAVEPVGRVQGVVSTGALVWRRLRRSRSAMLGLGVLVVFATCGVLAPWIAPYDPYASDLENSLKPPSSRHWLGTDELGRDLLSRILYGARLSMVIGTIAVAIGVVLGVPLGLLSGYLGGWFDLVVQRAIDVLLAFPSTVLAILLVTILGVGLVNVMIAVGIVSVPTYTRLVRGQVLSLKEQEFVHAARALGAGSLRIVFRHILPNTLAVLIVQTTLQVASAILSAAALGFLGLGVQQPTAEWGAMLSTARQHIQPYFAAPIPTGATAERSIRLYVALKKLVAREGWDFYTIQSFPGLGDDYSATCFAQSMMIQDGIATSTLSDFNTALTVKLLMDLSGERVYYGDLQHIDKGTGEIKIIGDGACPPSLAGSLEPATFAEHGIPTEGAAGGLSVQLTCRPGEGVLARLGRHNGAFEMVLARCTVVEPSSREELQRRKAECGIPFWPHAFVQVQGDLDRLIEAWNNEYAVLGYGAHLYDDLLAFCEITGIKAIAL
ncbi:MAG: ABC transporter permease subunit [Armatimonadota bacterium]|nr:ABC transporter permease subunit [Armatimonadota bacterium]